MTFLINPLLALCLLAFSGLSNAAIYEIFSTETDGSFEQKFTVNDAIDGVFTDTFNFYVNEDTSDFQAKLDGYSIFSLFKNIDQFSSAVIDNESDLTFATRLFGGENTRLMSISGLELSQGLHTLVVVGESSNGDIYTLNMSPIGSSAVSAVPEPSTYALMLAGLGLIGFMARRQNKMSS